MSESPRQDEKVYFFDKPDNVQRLLWGFYVVCGLLLLLDLVIHRHTYHPWERLFAFYPLYGFVGCVVLVLIAKWMRLFLMRGEDYYLAAEQANEATHALAGQDSEQGNLSDDEHRAE